MWEASREVVTKCNTRRSPRISSGMMNVTGSATRTPVALIPSSLRCSDISTRMLSRTSPSPITAPPVHPGCPSATRSSCSAALAVLSAPTNGCRAGEQERRWRRCRERWLPPWRRSSPPLQCRRRRYLICSDAAERHFADPSSLHSRFAGRVKPRVTNLQPRGRIGRGGEQHSMCDPLDRTFAHGPSHPFRMAGT